MVVFRLAGVSLGFMFAVVLHCTDRATDLIIGELAVVFLPAYSWRRLKLSARRVADLAQGVDTECVRSCFSLCALDWPAAERAFAVTKAAVCPPCQQMLLYILVIHLNQMSERSVVLVEGRRVPLVLVVICWQRLAPVFYRFFSSSGSLCRLLSLLPLCRRRLEQAWTLQTRRG